MTLVNRVSTFFLLALAAILVLFSLTTYLLLRHQLIEQFDQQLHGALHMLVAAVEVEPDDVKFEQTEHTISLGIEDGLEDIRWVVTDERQRIIARSPNSMGNDPADRHFDELVQTVASLGENTGSDGYYRFLRQTLSAPTPKSPKERDPKEHAAITLLVARSAADLNANLHFLALALIILSVVAWLVAAITGRWYCAKALSPVRKMAGNARQIAGTDFRTRIPIEKSDDEMAELARAFNSLLDRQQLAFDSQQRFAAEAAHQLRTPLTVLRGQMEVALRRERTLSEYQQTLALLREQSAEMEQIVEALLFLARSEADSAPPPAHPVPLSEWFHRYRDRWDGHPRGEDIRWHVDGLPVVELPVPLLAQLLDVLVGNALQYSGPGDLVTVSARLNSELVIEVADEGPGISAEDQEHIFEPFFRSTEARRRGRSGTGLGLAIASRIARSLGGRLQCDSALGRGSCFRIILPAPQPVPAAVNLPCRQV